MLIPLSGKERMKYRYIIKNLEADLQVIEEKYSKKGIKKQGSRSVRYKADKNHSVSKMDFLPAKVLRKIANNKKSNVNEEETGLNEKRKKTPSKNRKNPRQYDAPQGSKRDKGLDRAAALYAKGDVKGAAAVRDRMEKKARSKSGYRSKARHDTGRYTESSKFESKKKVRDLLEEIIEEVKLESLLKEVEEIIDEKKKKKSKSKGKLSAAVKKSLDKKADKRCLTRGSVYQEFRKGLAAYLSSGSRKGMSSHQWAHARVNSANPSKSWATVKKRKSCPKKKKKK